MSIKRLIRKDEIPNDLQISKKVYLEVGTDRAIKQCLEDGTFALCYRESGNRAITIYFIDKSVMFKSVLLHELKHVEQYEHGGWPKGPIREYNVSDSKNTYRVRGDPIELGATEYAIKHTSVAEVRKDVEEGYRFLRANDRMFEFNQALQMLKELGDRGEE